MPPGQTRGAGGVMAFDAEALAKQGVKAPRDTAPRRRPAEVAALEEQLRGSLGTRVDLSKGRKGGRIVIHYFSDEELESIVDRLR